MRSIFSPVAAAAAATLFAGAAQAVPVAVDLTSWTAEGPGSWAVQAGNDSVVQTLNNDPTVFHNGLNSQGQALAGEITVQTTGDDDYIGFVLGFQAGDLTSATASYLLIDWKQLDQGGFYGGVALDGLAISLVEGPLPEGAGAWLHDSASGVTELERAATLGSTGWADNTTYGFELVFQPTLVQVYVDGALEIDLTIAEAQAIVPGLAAFSDGGFGFYNYSQSNVLYAGITEEEAPPVGDVPVPAGLALLPAALLGLGALRRRA